jgi:hypothetical protein
MLSLKLVQSAISQVCHRRFRTFRFGMGAICCFLAALFPALKARTSIAVGSSESFSNMTLPCTLGTCQQNAMHDTIQQSLVLIHGVTAA